MPSTEITSYKPTCRYRSPCCNLDYFRVTDNPGTISPGSSNRDAQCGHTCERRICWALDQDCWGAECVARDEPETTLFLAEGPQRVELGRSAGWNVAGEHGHCCEEQWCAQEQEGIVHTDPERFYEHIR